MAPTGVACPGVCSRLTVRSELAWAAEQGCHLLDDERMVLKWANGLGCLWDRNTSFGAASSNGHLEAMQGAREQGPQ
eukprot:jgi/Tetstr1/440975/TSEL_029243.t1